MGLVENVGYFLAYFVGKLGILGDLWVEYGDLDMEVYG